MTSDETRHKFLTNLFNSLVKSRKRRDDGMTIGSPWNGELSQQWAHRGLPEAQGKSYWDVGRKGLLHPG